MSGGPLVCINGGEIFSVGVYNGPAAVPGHRMFALLQYTDVILSD